MAGTELLANHATGPGAMHLGTRAPDASVIDPLRRERLQYVSQLAANLPEEQQGALWQRYGMLPYDRYLSALRNRSKWRRELEKDGLLRDTKTTYDLRAFVLNIYDEDLHSPDLQGWINYLCAVTPLLGDELAKVSLAANFREAERDMHTLITAGTGWGKSALMKTLAYHYIRHSFSAVVMLDPHGDMVGEVARFREFVGNDRLIYVEPGLADGYTVGLNPLDARGLDAEARALYAVQLSTAISELTAELSPNMRALARNCLRVLLDDGNATLFDLLKLVPQQSKRAKGQAAEPEDPRRAALVAKGRRYPDPIVSDFFRNDLDADSYESTRKALRTRIAELLSIPSWAAMTCGPSTLNLQAALDARKVILVNLGPLGSEGAASMGRLIVSMVAAIGRRRESTPPAARVPCHVFVDEASTMVSPAMGRILAELRKYRVHLTLAQHVGGVGFDETGRRLLTANTACQLVGSNNRADLRGVFADANMRDVPKIAPRSFWVRWGFQGEPVCIRIRSDLEGDRNAMTAEQWQVVAANQVRRYYREARPLTPGPDGPDQRPPGAPAGSPAKPRRTLE